MRQSRALLIITLFLSIIYLLSLYHPSASLVTRTTRRLIYGRTYKAPFHCPIPPEDVDPNKYSVVLHRGYTLDEHLQSIGIELDLKTGIGGQVFYDLHRASLMYYTELDERALEAVAADWGVDRVNCRYRARVDV